MPFCVQCGAKLEDGAKFCTVCGTRQPDIAAPVYTPPAAGTPDAGQTTVLYPPPGAGIADAGQTTVLYPSSSAGNTDPGATTVLDAPPAGYPGVGQNGYSYDPTISQGAKKKSGGKKGGKVVFILLAALAVIAALVYVVAGKLGGGSAKVGDDVLGLYTAQKAETNGDSISIESMWENGFSIELKNKGKAEITVDGNKGSANWTLDGERFTISGSGIDCSGTLKNGVMTLENVMNSGVTLTFNKDGGAAPGGESGLTLLPQGDGTAFSDDPAAISQTALSVVKLSCYDQNGELFCTGSGFCLFEEGTVITNYHVISENCYRIVAVKEDGQSFEISTIVAYDADKDIAILKTKARPQVELLEYSTRQLEKGEKVVAIGSPLGLLNSVSAGVFSGYVEEDDVQLIQFTASISQGSSGGPLFDNEGRVIGITSAYFVNGQNLNLAVPIEEVVNLWDSRALYTPVKVSEFYQSSLHQNRTGIDWWEGDWYGWWVVFKANGTYASDGYADLAWDACARIEVSGSTANIDIWDEDGDDIAWADLNFGPGGSDRGSMTSAEGYFYNDQITKNEWVIDPTDPQAAGFEDLIVIHGKYAQPSNANNWIEYYIFLRPWGTIWEDIETGDTSSMIYPGDMMPMNYMNWYLPLIDAGKGMPDDFAGLEK